MRAFADRWWATLATSVRAGTYFLLTRNLWIADKNRDRSADKIADKNSLTGQFGFAKCFVFYGERGRNRTFNLLIKSLFWPLSALYRLVYSVYNIHRIIGLRNCAF